MPVLLRRLYTQLCTFFLIHTVFFSTQSTFVSAAKLNYNLTISLGAVTPDCQGFPVSANDTTNNNIVSPHFLINGQFTGPTIRGSVGDTLIITVINTPQTNVSISMHWHGLKQRGTPFSDGAAGISNAGIRPGQSFTYTIHLTAEDYGTHFYHAHSGFLSLHLFGPLIVQDANRDKLYTYDEDRIITLTDYWAASPVSLEQGLLASPSKPMGHARSLLHNGKSLLSTCLNSTLQNSSSFDMIPVDPGKRYRLRIIGALSHAFLHWRLEGHVLTLIEVDGTLIDPLVVDNVHVAPGQRYSLLIETNQPASDYWMRAEARFTMAGPNNGYALLRYSRPAVGNNGKDVMNGSIGLELPRYKLSDAPTDLLLPFEDIHWVYKNIKPKYSSLQTSILALPSNVTRTLVIDIRQIPFGNDSSSFRWTLNNITFQLPSEFESKPLLDRIYENPSLLTTLPPSTRPISVNKNQVLDIIFQNRVGLDGHCHIHPWHIHGHSFFDMGDGPGLYNASSPNLMNDINNQNSTDSLSSHSHMLPNPILRDTVVLFPYSHSHLDKLGTPDTPCGWRKVRLVADNPGLWPLHCHVASHMSMGMATTLFVGTVQDLPSRP